MARKKQARGLVLAAGHRPHMRARSRTNWTKAKKDEFLTVLGETCNVTQAAREAGVSISYAYKKRVADAAFREGWANALATAYRRLELVLLERAFNGSEKVLTRKDGSEERMREYSNQLGLSLLKMHHDGAAQSDVELPAETVDEIRELLVKKLKRLKARDEQPNPSDA